MLTPDYLASCTDYLLKLYGDLEDEIIRDIARRIVKTGVVTATAEWQANQLEELGTLQDQIIERVAQSAGKREREIRKLFQESAIRNIETNAEPLISHGINVSLALSPAMRDVLKAAIERTEGNIRNLTLTTGSTSGELYLQCSNEAYMKAVSGAFSPQEAIYQAVKKAGAEGATVQFATRKDKLDVTIRRNVMTSVNQTAGRITVMHAADLGAEFYETSAHPGARPTHAEWQGQVFQISGSSRGYPNFYDATGYGEVDGLCGVNCRHSFYPFFPEYSERAYSDEKLQEYADQSVEYNGARYSYYESSQIQRKLERSIRESKRILTGIDAARDAAEDDATRERLSDGFAAESVKLKEKEAKLKDFLKQTGRSAENDRVRVVSWNRSLAQSARRANERVEKEALNAILKAGDKSGALNPDSKRAEKHAARYYGLIRSMKTDVKRVAKASGFSEDEIREIKNFIFMEKHDLGGSEPQFFYPDYSMAQSWQRLVNGTPKPHDITLLEHERMERRLMRQGMTQDEAHTITSQKFNYAKEAKEYYDSLREHRKKK